MLGYHRFWLGLDDFDYRAWAVPAFQTNAAYMDSPLAIDEILDDMAPDVILIDPVHRAYFDGATAADTGSRAARRWMVSRGYVRVAEVIDRTYGRMEIFRKP